MKLRRRRVGFPGTEPVQMVNGSLKIGAGKTKGLLRRISLPLTELEQQEEI